MSVVYFIQAGTFIKIGTTRNLADRVAAIATSSPFRPEVLATIPGDRELEQSLHAELRGNRVHLEWFNDCVEVRSAMHRCVRDLGGAFMESPEPQRDEMIESRSPARPWDGLNFELLDAITQTIVTVTDRFNAIIYGEALQDGAKARRLEHELSLSHNALMQRIYRCKSPAQEFSATVKLVGRCSRKFTKVTDRAIIDSAVGDTSRANALCHAATLLIERAESAVTNLQHVPGALAFTISDATK